ncbi:MAG: FtsQ-type POTRA domain-containing protein [Verrucomicrobiota bacterium]
MRKKRKNSTTKTKSNVLNVQVVSKTDARKLYMQAGLIVLAVSTIVLVCFAVHLATKTLFSAMLYENERFTIDEIEVLNEGELARDEILRQADVYVGDNLMNLNLDRIVDEIEAMPSVAKARVERILPSKLRIDVDERQPVAKITPYSKTGSRLAQEVYYIDSEGYVMKPRPGEKIKSLPNIIGVESSYVIEGFRIKRTEVLSVLNLLHLADMSAVKGELDLTRIEIEDSGHIKLFTFDQGTITFKTQDLAQQIGRLKYLLNWARSHGQKIRNVDLTPRENVPVTFKRI